MNRLVDEKYMDGGRTRDGSRSSVDSGKEREGREKEGGRNSTERFVSLVLDSHQLDAPKFPP